MKGGDYISPIPILRIDPDPSKASLIPFTDPKDGGDVISQGNCVAGTFYRDNFGRVIGVPFYHANRPKVCSKLCLRSGNTVTESKGLGEATPHQRYLRQGS